MNSYGIRIVVPEGKVKEILDRLTAALPDELVGPP